MCLKLSPTDLIKAQPDYARLRIIRALYEVARDGTPEEFAAAFDRCDEFRAREIEAWKKIASEAVACRTPAYVLPAGWPGRGE